MFAQAFLLLYFVPFFILFVIYTFLLFLLIFKGSFTGVMCWFLSKQLTWKSKKFSIEMMKLESKSQRCWRVTCDSMHLCISNQIFFHGNVSLATTAPEHGGQGWAACCSSQIKSDICWCVDQARSLCLNLGIFIISVQSCLLLPTSLILSTFYTSNRAAIDLHKHLGHGNNK